MDTTDEGENGTGARIAAAAVANDLATYAILLGVEGDSGVSDAREFGERAGEEVKSTVVDEESDVAKAEWVIVAGLDVFART